MLKLAKTELPPLTEQRLIRMMKDVVILCDQPAAEIRAAYDTIEQIRDALSRLLDRVDGKHV